MELKDNLNKASALKLELDDLRPLSAEQENRIMQKFRLDWNYHSSNIEGNSLTYGETKALILFGQTAQAKPLKDHLEISGHDEAVKSIEEIIKKERPLTESFIRELHEIILKQPYQVDAVTPDGKPTKKWVSVGKYKTVPNHVKTKTGEMFYFASPEETPAKMDDLMKWFSEEIKNGEIHTVILATEFHYRFIRIHPFDDGNGRIARLLMNFVLMLKGYPPAIIKTEEKNDYYNALEQADAGNIDFFFNFICDHVNNSLELMLKAARGGEIEDADDLDKKLQLLKLRLGKKPNSKVNIKKSSDSIKSAIEKSIIPLIKELEQRLIDFDGFFKSREVKVEYSGVSSGGTNLFDVFNYVCTNYIYKDLDAKKLISIINIKSFFNGLVGTNQSISVRGITLEIVFHENVYEIIGSGIKTPVNKLYDDFPEPEEIKEIVNSLGNWLYQRLEEIVKKSEH
jgi:Fic family protein